MDANSITAYVDGCFLDDQIAYAAVLLNDDQVLAELSGRYQGDVGRDARQVAGELQAVLATLDWCQQHGVAAVIICYDYEGIAKWVTGAWKARQPLTQEYSARVRAASIAITWQKVPSHTGIKWNERADQLAKAAAQGQKQGQPTTTTGEDPMTALQAKADAFVAFCAARGLTAAVAGILNQQYARIVVSQGQEHGIFDLYNTRKKPFSPYLHDFSREGFKSRVTGVWQQFVSGAPSDDSQGDKAPVEAVPEVEHYYRVLKPFAGYRFDFAALAQAIAKALPPGEAAQFDPSLLRYDFPSLERLYKQLKEGTQ